MNTISDRIKYIRTEALGKKLTLEEFGESLGITKSAAFNLENSDRLANGISEPVKKLICKVYHVSYMWLCEGVGDVFDDSDNLHDAVDRIMSGSDVFTRTWMKALVDLPYEDFAKFKEQLEQIEALRAGAK